MYFKLVLHVEEDEIRTALAVIRELHKVKVMELSSHYRNAEMRRRTKRANAEPFDPGKYPPPEPSRQPVLRRPSIKLLPAPKRS